MSETRTTEVEASTQEAVATSIATIDPKPGMSAETYRAFAHAKNLEAVTEIVAIICLTSLALSGKLDGLAAAAIIGAIVGVNNGLRTLGERAARGAGIANAATVAVGVFGILFAVAVAGDAATDAIFRNARAAITRVA